MENNIKFLSFNTKGIQTKTKRDKVFYWLNSRKCHFLLLQETHSDISQEQNWNEEWGRDIIYSHGDTNSRGVAILMDLGCDYKINNTFTDQNGRFITLDMEINGEKLSVVNIYASNEDDLTKIKEYGNDRIIWAGDFNLVLDVALDKLGGTNKTHTKCQAFLKEKMMENNWVDIWRQENPNTRKFTWRSNPMKVKPRSKDFGLVQD